VSGASVQMNIRFVSLNPDVCIFSFNDYVIFKCLVFVVQCVQGVSMISVVCVF
jgi:hypothetical protein